MMPRSKAARRPSKAQRIKTAYHEAGHAVINRVLTLTCGPTTIKPDYEKQEWGHSISIALEHEWERCGKYRGPNAVWHAQIISRMAGAEAERELLDTESEGDHDDRLQIACVVSEFVPEDYFWDKLEPRLRAMTRMLVRRHKASIKRVAEALLAKTTLSGAQLDKLVGGGRRRGATPPAPASDPAAPRAPRRRARNQ